MEIKAYITGDTYRFRDILRKYGYAWDAESKAWTRTYETPVDENDVIRDVRALPGIRNRGNFSARIEK